MSFVVVGKSPSSHYTQISNALIRNSEIDDSTFRLICWMSSHDEGYQINFKNIQFALGYGRDKLRKILKNAEIHNYLVRRKIRTDGGLFDFEYHIFKDTSHAIAFSKSLPQSELTNHNRETDSSSTQKAGRGDGEQGSRGETDSNFFSSAPLPLCTSASHNAKFTQQTTDVTRGGFTGGGQTGGGSTGGGESAPLLKEQYRENQIKEEQEEEETPSPSKNSLCEYEVFCVDSQLTPQNFVSLSNLEESSTQNDNPKSGSKIPSRLFDNPELPNFENLPTQEFSLSNTDAIKLEKYQQLDASGIKLKQPELRDWARLSMGSYVKTYRKSGFILTGGNDVSTEFAIYVAKQNCRKGQDPTIALGFNVINKCEGDPRCWQKLVVWVTEWQQLRQTGQNANVAATVNQQQQLERIRQAASTKFEL